MKRLLLLVSLSLLVPFAADAAPQMQVLPNRFVIGFKKGIKQADRKAIIEKMGGKVLKDLSMLNIVLAEPGLKPAAVFKAQMAVRPEVMGIENDFVTKWIETDPLLDAQLAIRAGLKHRLADLQQPPTTQEGEVQWGVAKVNAPAAWPTNQGAGVKVAVVDTGIDNTHPELAGAVVSGYNAVEKEKPWVDDHFHGTHVAGIIAATMNGAGVVGVAPQAKLYAVKVLTKEGSGSMFGILDGMNWCASNGIQVANMSLGAAQGNFLFEYGVKNMVGAGVALIAAAGNGDGNGGPSPVNFPAAYAEAVAVSAGTPDDKITPWSSRGPEVDFIAPGLKVPSTVPLWHDASGVKAYSGTSMATPHVAGLAALAVAKGANSPDAVRAALTAAASPLPGLSQPEQGAGLINAAKLK